MAVENKRSDYRLPDQGLLWGLGMNGSAEESLGMRRDVFIEESASSRFISGSSQADVYTRMLSLEKILEALRDEISELREQLEERPNAYTTQIFDLASSTYSLRVPILVVVEAYSEEIVARLPEFDLYASGVSDSVALANLKSEIASTYTRLVELGTEKLGPLALQWFEAMNLIIERRYA